MKTAQVKSILDWCNSDEFKGDGYRLTVQLLSGYAIDICPVGIKFDCLFSEGEGGGGPGLMINCASIAAIDVRWV